MFWNQKELNQGGGYPLEPKVDFKNSKEMYPKGVGLVLLKDNQVYVGPFDEMKRDGFKIVHVKDMINQN